MSSGAIGIELHFCGINAKENITKAIVRTKHFLCRFKGIVQPKMNFVIIYSPCCSVPISSSIKCYSSPNGYFPHNDKSLWPWLSSSKNDKTQHHSILKIVNTTCALYAKSFATNIYQKINIDNLACVQFKNSKKEIYIFFCHLKGRSHRHTGSGMEKKHKGMKSWTFFNLRHVFRMP